MRLRTFGSLELQGSRFNRPKPLLLLCYLTLEGAKDRRYLSTLFWPNAKNPATSLRVALNRLKNGVPDALIINDHNVQTTLPSDAQTLLTAIQTRDYQQAISLYTGSFLAGFDLQDSSVELEEWVYGMREFLASQVRQAYVWLAEQAALKGAFHDAALLAEKGFRTAGAADPEPDVLERLYLLMLTGESFQSSLVKDLAAEYGLDLNVTQKDARAAFETRAAPSAHNNVATNLVQRGNPFVGRAEELRTITGQLQQPDCRLLTLHGAGGVGKTRLVTQAGATLLANKVFADGVFFVALDVLDNPAHIAAEIATTLGLSLSEHQDAFSAVTAHIAKQHMLLILDNYEQVMQGATMTSRLLRACLNLKLLVTSRERLNVAEEFAYLLNGLPVPEHTHMSLQDAQTYDVIQLFVERARRARLEFQLRPEDVASVIWICQLVEGLPLGVELAAAGVKLMNPQEIAQSITFDMDTLYTTARDVSERHQSLRATFEYSWALLTPKEQAALTHLSVCVGGFTREAASQIANVSIPVLVSLVDKSLLRVNTNGRYDRHVLLYEFTREKHARTPGKNDAEQKHAHYYLNLAQTAAPHLLAEQQATWYKKLEDDKDNLRQALRYLLTHAPEDALKLGVALRRYWETRGYVREGGSWLTDALSIVSNQRSELYAQALYAAGSLAHKQRDMTRAEQYLQRCANLAREESYAQVLADTLNLLAGIAWSQNKLSASRALLEESLATKRTLNDDRGIAAALSNLGLLEFVQGHYARAQSLYTGSLARYRDFKDQRQIASTLRKLGRTYYRCDAHDDASRALQEALSISRELRDELTEGRLLNDLGCLACHERQYQTATQHLNESLAIARRLKAPRDIANALQGLGLIHYAQQDYAVAETYFMNSLEFARDGYDAESIAAAAEGLASIAAQHDAFTRAALLWGMAQGLAGEAFELIRVYLPACYAQDVQRVKTALGEDAFVSLVRSVQGVDTADVIAFAFKRWVPDSVRQLRN